MVTFARRIQHERTSRGLTLRGAARLAGVSYTTWYRWEQRFAYPTICQVAKLAEGLGKTFHELMDGVHVPPDPRVVRPSETTTAAAMDEA